MSFSPFQPVLFHCRRGNESFGLVLRFVLRSLDNIDAPLTPPTPEKTLGDVVDASLSPIVSTNVPSTASSHGLFDVGKDAMEEDDPTTSDELVQRLQEDEARRSAVLARRYQAEVDQAFGRGTAVVNTEETDEGRSAAVEAGGGMKEELSSVTAVDGSIDAREEEVHAPERGRYGLPQREAEGTSESTHPPDFARLLDRLSAAQRDPTVQRPLLALSSSLQPLALCGSQMDVSEPNLLGPALVRVERRPVPPFRPLSSLPPTVIRRRPSTLVAELYGEEPVGSMSSDKIEADEGAKNGTGGRTAERDVRLPLPGTNSDNDDGASLPKTSHFLHGLAAPVLGDAFSLPETAADRVEVVDRTSEDLRAWEQDNANNDEPSDEEAEIGKPASDVDEDGTGCASSNNDNDDGSVSSDHATDGEGGESMDWERDASSVHHAPAVIWRQAGGKDRAAALATLLAKRRSSMKANTERAGGGASSSSSSSSVGRQSVEQKPRSASVDVGKGREDVARRSRSRSRSPLQRRTIVTGSEARATLLASAAASLSAPSAPSEGRVGVRVVRIYPVEEFDSESEDSAEDEDEMEDESQRSESDAMSSCSSSNEEGGEDESEGNGSESEEASGAEERDMLDQSSVASPPPSSAVRNEAQVRPPNLFPTRDLLPKTEFQPLRLLQRGGSATPADTTASPDDSFQTHPTPAVVKKEVKKEAEEEATSLPEEDIKPELSRLAQNKLIVDKLLGLKDVFKEIADAFDKKRKREADQDDEESEESEDDEDDENFATQLEADLAALRAAHSPPASTVSTKSVSAQTDQAEQVSASTSTSTDAVEQALSVDENPAPVPMVSVERVVAPLPSRQASPMNEVAADDPPAPQPVDNVVPPAVELLFDVSNANVNANHRGPDDGAPPPVAQNEVVIAHAPEARINDRRPTKRARIGTFLLGAIAGSVASIGALASYGAGDLV